MLEKDFNRRISAKKVLQNPWIQKNTKNEELDNVYLTNLTKFCVLKLNSLIINLIL